MLACFYLNEQLAGGGWRWLEGGQDAAAWVSCSAVARLLRGRWRTKAVANSGVTQVMAARELTTNSVQKMKKSR